MSYHNKNVQKKRRHAMEVTAQHYEPGRQDRCYRWVWNKYIKDTFHVEYKTYLHWVRTEKKNQQDTQQSLF